MNKPMPNLKTQESTATAYDSANEPHRESLTHLLKQVAEDLPTLLSKEIALAKAELREAADQVKAGLGGLAGGAGLMLAGLFFILLSAVYALGLVVPAWAAALIVGVTVLVVGYAMVKAGQKKVEPKAFVPERTIDSVEKDKDMTKRITT